MKVIIAGAGVGGLVTALMLHARGIDCDVFEQADAVRELGVGINTLPHAIKELAELGLLDRLDASRSAPTSSSTPTGSAGDLARAARPRRRLRHPAILDPSRTVQA
jgi:2-polyprenyl-6-methoxyphenol hydroxylase-like FAD-dependent oxidoreductase